MALFSKYRLSFLATEILEEIIELLLRKTLFQCIEIKSQYMELLITPSLRRLNLYNWSPDDAAQVSILHLISVRCPVSFVAISSILSMFMYFVNHLQKLQVLQWRFSDESSLGLPLHKIFISMFHNLQKLDISGTVEGDDCLEIIGAFCKDLR